MSFEPIARVLQAPLSKAPDHLAERIAGGRKAILGVGARAIDPFLDDPFPFQLAKSLREQRTRHQRYTPVNVVEGASA